VYGYDRNFTGGFTPMPTRPQVLTETLIHRFDIETYHRMIDAGILHEDDRVELINGRIVDMTPIGTGHASCVKRLNQIFHQRLQGRVIVGVQDPILLLKEESEPQPDITLLKWKDDFYKDALPGPKDIFLVIEVADTSHEYDRGIKIPLYGRAGIREAWLVDLKDNTVEIYREPSTSGYSLVKKADPAQTISPTAFPDIKIQVKEILGI